MVVTEAFFILAVVVVTAVAFDFTNGFHDTGNAMATSIATGALTPKVAVGLSAVLNLVGAFLSVQVALTISNKVLDIQTKSGAPSTALMGAPILTIVSPVWSPASSGIWRPGCSACRPARPTP